MTDDQQLIEGSDSALQPETTLRNERREFFRAALGAAAATAAGAGALSIATSASAATIVDNDMGNFLLQIEYLVAQYYSFAATGTGLPSTQISGVGTAGAATGARQVSFTDPLVGQYAREAAQDTASHVAFLRSTLGTDGATAQPAIDLGVTATSAFSKLAAAAGVVSTGAAFDVYASDENFLLGAYMIQDVIVTGYAGAVASISDKTLIGQVLGLLSSHSHYSAVIRSLLYSKGVATPALRTNANNISDTRDQFDGVGSDPSKDLDRGITKTVGTDVLPTIAPVNPEGLVLGRATGQVLNVLYQTSAAATSGGFYTAGLNGAVKASSASV